MYDLRRTRLNLCEHANMRHSSVLRERKRFEQQLSCDRIFYGSKPTNERTNFSRSRRSKIESREFFSCGRTHSRASRSQPIKSFLSKGGGNDNRENSHEDATSIETLLFNSRQLHGRAKKPSAMVKRHNRRRCMGKGDRGRRNAAHSRVHVLPEENNIQWSTKPLPAGVLDACGSMRRKNKAKH